MSNKFFGDVNAISHFNSKDLEDLRAGFLRLCDQRISWVFVKHSKSESLAVDLEVCIMNKCFR